MDLHEDVCLCSPTNNTGQWISMTTSVVKIFLQLRIALAAYAGYPLTLLCSTLRRFKVLSSEISGHLVNWLNLPIDHSPWPTVKILQFSLDSAWHAKMINTVSLKGLFSIFGWKMSFVCLFYFCVCCFSANVRMSAVHQGQRGFKESCTEEHHKELMSNAQHNTFMFLL